jgi:hypothetical protein
MPKRFAATFGSIVLVVASLGVAAPAHANSSLVWNWNGATRGSVAYNSSTNTFTVRDLYSDGFGVDVEWSYTGSMASTIATTKAAPGP